MTTTDSSSAYSDPPVMPGVTQPPEPPFVCPECHEAERILKHRRGDKSGFKTPPEYVDGVQRKCSICFGFWKDGGRVNDWQSTKTMKVRMIARGMSTMDDFRIVDMESGNELPVISFEVLPCTVDHPILRMRMVIYLHGGLDVEAAAEVTTRKIDGTDDPTRAERDQEQARREEHFK